MAGMGNDNVRNVGRNLYIGDYLVSINYEILLHLNITHILNCAEELSPRYPETFKYLHLMIDDSPDTQISQHFDKAFEFISEGVRTGCVLVHCAQGCSRSVSFVLMYLMKSRKISFKSSLKALKQLYPNAFPNPGFCKQLKAYEKTLNISKSSCLNSIF